MEGNLCSGVSWVLGQPEHDWAVLTTHLRPLTGKERGQVHTIHPRESQEMNPRTGMIPFHQEAT